MRASLSLVDPWGGPGEGGVVLVELSMVEQRYEAVMAVLRDGEPVAEVAARPRAVAL